MKQISLLIIIFLGLIHATVQGQEPAPTKKNRQSKQYQTVRGQVIDKYSRLPVVGALVSVDNVYPFLSAYANDNGLFTIERVPVGRQTFSVEMKGYSRLEQRGVVVSTGKELFIELEISNLDAQSSNKPNNELLLVSSRSLSVEEMQRFPATFNDPNRMNMSFAGVQPLRDGDSDVNTRGNSSMTALYRLEGLDIPNPNHFAFMAVMGGGLTVFSTSVLNGGDWSIGAWSADYGNSITSATDLKFRKGNLYKKEHNFQAGLLGLNLATEGPLKKERSSYLINYRYSTLGLLSAAGVYLVRDNVSNTFQDVSFNLHFTSKNNKTSANVFGVVGLSNENWFIKKDTSEWLSDLDYIRNKNGSSLAILGANINHTFNEKSFMNIVVGTTASLMYFNRWKPDNPELTSGTVIDTHLYRNLSASIAATYNRKVSEKLVLKTGIIAKEMLFDLNYGKTDTGVYTRIINALSHAELLQGFVAGVYRPVKNLAISGGIHSLFFTLNNTYSVEPRLALRYKMLKKTTVGLAYGQHGAVLPTGAYFVQVRNPSTNEMEQVNRNLKLLKSNHFVASLEQKLSENTYLLVEGFYQQILNAPIREENNSTFWYFNTRDTQGDGRYISEGEGRNYGINLTLEKKFSQGYYAILAANYGYSQFKTLDNIWLSTQNDARFFNILTGGREINLPKNQILQLNARIFFGEGIRFILPDTAATLAQEKLILDYSKGWAGIPNYYFRADIRASYRKNFKKTSFVASLDIQNVSNHKNQRDVQYNEKEKILYKRYLSGLTPLINFQLFF